MTLQDYMRMWLETYIDPRRAPSTQQGYRYALAHMPGDVMGCTLGDVQAIDLQRAVNLTAARYPRQAQILYTVLHGAYRKGVVLGLMDRNLMDYCEMPEHETRNIPYLEGPELQEYAHRAMDDRECGAALLLMAMAALRIGEAVEQGPGQLDAKRDQLTVAKQQGGRKPKRGSVRVLPIDRDLTLYLRMWYGTRDKASLLGVGGVRGRHGAILDAMGHPERVTPHGLRHSCATYMLRGGASMFEVQHYLGHKNYEVTAKTYAHCTTEALRPAARVMGGLLAG